MDRVNLYGTFIQLIYTTHLYDSFIRLIYTTHLYGMMLHIMTYLYLYFSVSKLVCDLLYDVDDEFEMVLLQDDGKSEECDFVLQSTDIMSLSIRNKATLKKF